MKFSFGRNWLSYSTRALTQEKVEAARTAFQALTRGISLRGARFLDIGFGQGLALFFAAEAGAQVHGLDADPVCTDALKVTGRFFPAVPPPKITIGSILDDTLVETQRAGGGFDVVHSWGVLHHTGNMRKSFQNAAALVRPSGYLIISIYNKHWTSPIWRSAKRIFNALPQFLQEAAIFIFYPVFYWRARRLSGAGPITQRGMDIRHDLRDWLGGYPYEYASTQDIIATFATLGFALAECEPTRGFTGCNEFVFQKQS